MKTTHESEVQVPKEDSAVEVEKPKRSLTPAPERGLSFEEALQRSATENKELLRRLAQ